MENKMRDQIKKILDDAEKSLLDLTTSTPFDGDYENLELVISYAKKINHLSKMITDERSGNLADTEKPIMIHTNRSSIKKRRQPSKDYPRFIKNDNILIKVGWSKKSKREYRHKTNVEIINAVVKTFSDQISPGNIFKMEDMLPLMKTSDGSEIPSYQVYIVLAWLISIGKINKHGREGYSANKINDVIINFESFWNQIKNFNEFKGD